MQLEHTDQLKLVKDCSWNNTDRDYPSDKTIQELFEEQVNQNPDSIAVIYGGHKLTYEELNCRANRLANYIKQEYNIKPDTLVALCLDRSEYMLVAILATLKAGGAYVPIDHNYPDARIKYILEDTGVKLILTNNLYKERLEDINNHSITKKIDRPVEVLVIDNEELKKQLMLQSIVNPEVTATSTNLAYVIYTSGTTGNPKGVMQLHRNVIRLFIATYGWYKFNNNDIWTLYHSYVFDFSIWEMWGALIYGGKLIITSYEQTRDLSIFYDLCRQEYVTVLNHTPSAFYQFIDIATIKHIQGRLTNLRCVIFGGELLNLSQLKTWFGYYGYDQPKLVNMYGITETTVHVTYKAINENDVGGNSCIGNAIPDMKVYILDNNLALLPVGAIGELYVGGEGLSRGYLNRSDLTAERFIANQFQTEEEKKLNKNVRIYRIGDLARWLPDGNLEYIGRNDFQVKIRGYRIELGEIENVLLGYQGIKQVVVLAKDRIDNNSNLTENKYLIAYYVKELNLKNQDINDFVNIWEMVYQTEYLSLDINNFKQNIKGWNSSYTGRPIAKKDMLEWINVTTKRIKQLNPSIILEIGSGSGLLLFNIIDNCKYYYATDLSNNVIDYTSTVINKFGYNNKVSVLNCAADQLPYHKLKKPYDTVIINSVAQLFPNLSYFKFVIAKAISHMEGSGQIFIGDIRDYRLFKCFHYSVLKHKIKKVTKADVDYFAKRDKKLLISPQYFIYLQTINKFIWYVEIMPRLGMADNEMNNYRYDVVLYINKDKQKNNITESRININGSNFVKILDFKGYVALNINNDYLYIKYPNKRIIKDYIEYNELYNNELPINENDCNTILSLNEISEILKKANYTVKFLLDVQDPLYFNIIAYKNNLKQKCNVYLNNFVPKFSEPNLANNPLVTAKLLAQELTKELKRYLNSKLPSYMVPEYYVQLEKLPLTINGKLDRQALPDSEFINKDDYIAPRNELERRVCLIWGEILGLDEDKVGINDDFFRLGGNSILAIKLVNKLNKELNSNISVSVLFIDNTVEKLVNYIKYGVKDDLIIDEVKDIKTEAQLLSFAQVIRTVLWTIDTMTIIKNI